MSNEQKRGLHGCFTPIALVCMVMVAFVSFFCGGLTGQLQIYHRDSGIKIREISNVLASDPSRYSGLRVRKGSRGRTFITGTVVSQEDKDNLRVKIIKLYGEKEGISSTRSVDVRPNDKALGTENGEGNVPEEKKEKDSLTEKKIEDKPKK